MRKMCIALHYYTVQVVQRNDVFFSFAVRCRRNRAVCIHSCTVCRYQGWKKPRFL